MTRQDGGTGPAPAYRRASHMGRPIVAVARALTLVAALFLLPACEALLGSVATVGGTYLLGAIKEDGDRNIAWRAKQAEIVANVITGMQTQCRALEGPDMTKALKCYENLLAFHADQLPKILVERLADRARRARGTENGTGAQQALPARAENIIAPKMVAPQ